jgi:hypothetical protein
MLCPNLFGVECFALINHVLFDFIGSLLSLYKKGRAGGQVCLGPTRLNVPSWPRGPDTAPGMPLAHPTLKRVLVALA